MVIVGTGFGGISAAVTLQNMGIDDFVMLERRSFVGGTWQQNRYPGAAVDVQSPLYSLSFAPHDWSQMFAQQDELADYTKSLFQRFNLTSKVQLNAHVNGLCWQPEDARWKVEINDQEQFLARFVINASGPLSTPVIPHFQGAEDFQGEQFHTNDWPTHLDLTGKRVAIIGSGASAVQVIPAIADTVSHLDVFQRTPHWMLPRQDRRFRPWQRRLLRSKLGYNLLRGLLYCALETRILAFKYSPKLLNLLGTRPATAHLHKQVKDPKLRAQLTPDYTIGCKRILVSNHFYPTLQKSHVTLHDKADGITRITPTGIQTQQGNKLDLDVIIYATGFDATDGLISYPVKGKQGQLLSEVWKAFPQAYLGTCVAGIPNFFVVTGPNTGIGHTSALYMIESQMRYIAQAIRAAKTSSSGTIEVKQQAQDRYTQAIHSSMKKTVWYHGGCHSWYKSRDGKVVAMYPGFSFHFRWLCRWFRRQDHHISL